MIKILYFASLRERLGSAEEQVEHNAASDNIAKLLHLLRDRGGIWEQAFGPSQTLLVAINQEMATRDSPISDGDEVGLFPPVTGG